VVKTMPEMISRDGADTETYVARSERGLDIDLSTSPRALMADAKIADAAAPAVRDRPASQPQITPQIVKENLRRVKAGAANTLIRVLPDGKREYHEDRVVRGADGLQDTVTHGQRSDRGEGTTESAKLLSEEGKVRVDGLLPKAARDSSSRFIRGQG
jgi:hypothetical protein